MKLFKENRFIRREGVDYTVFKVTPHSSTLNSNARRFQSSIYDLFSYKYTKYPWQRERGLKILKAENLYITIKDNPKYWWIVRMTGENIGEGEEKDTVRTIEFFIAVPTDFKEAFKTKFNNHKQWNKSTLEELEEDFAFPDKEHTDLVRMKYTQNDMFSLNFDYKEQTLPVRDIMSVSKELKDSEGVSIFIQSETVSRRRWKKLVDYSWEIWDKGRVPSRPGFDSKMIFSDLTNLAVIGFHEIKGVVDDILYGISKSFFNDKDEPKKHKRPSFTHAEREALLVNGDLSRTTKNKRNQPVFKTNIMYAVTSKDKVRREMLSRSVTNAFSELNGDNVLKPIKVTINPKKELEMLRDWKIEDMNPNLMSVEELGKLQQLPTSELQKEFESSLESNRRVEIEIDEELLDDSGILAGTATLKGVKHNLHIQTKNPDIRATARAFIGSPRMGKDQAAINMVVESKLKHNIGAVVLDVINEQNGHRGMADAIRDHVPPEDIIDLNLMDTENPIYLGLEPIASKLGEARIASDRIAEELCSFLLTDGDEDKLRTVEYLREAAKLTNSDILGIRHMFTSDYYRGKLVEAKKDIFDTDIWEQYDKLSEGQKQSIYTPVMRRIGQIMSSEILKPMFCQRPNTNLDLFKLIDEGKVIIFRMKVGLMSERVIEILSYWIVLITFLIKLIQDGNSKNNNGTLLVLNEPNQYMTDNLAYFIKRILTEGPKYRLTPLLIFHNFEQFRENPGFIKIMKSSSLNWNIFKNTNDEVYKEMFNYLGRTFETPQQAFEATKKYQYIGVWLDSEGNYYDPFVADSLPMVIDRYPTQDNSFLTRRHSKMYGRPIKEVLEEIRARNKEALKEVKKN